jgi:hypothetical protein
MIDMYGCDIYSFFPYTKVGNSEAALLDKLNIKPFTYGLIVEQVYDNGSTYR